MTSSAKARQGVTDRLRWMVTDVIRTLHVPRLVYGVVTAVSSTTPTCSIQLHGTTTTITGVKFSTSYAPVVNDVVFCARVGADLFVMGKVAIVTSAWIGVGTAGAPAFSAGWANTVGISPLQFRLVGDIAFLRGQVLSANAVPSTIFVLPAAYRPPSQHNYAVNMNGSFGVLRVGANGNVIAQSGNPSVLMDIVAQWSVA